MSIKVNDRVKVVKADGELSPLVGATGEVIRIYDLSRTIAAVKITPDETIAREIIIKLPVEYLEKIGSQTQETEIPEGAKKISRADYLDALSEITNPEKMDVGSIGKFIAAMSVVVVGNRISDKIFKDCDVVVMTESDFISALWDACSPAKIAEYGKRDFDRDVIRVSITTMIGLEEIVGILFGGSND